jgi:uncharacterized protein (TIGR03435 family)
MILSRSKVVLLVAISCCASAQMARPQFEVASVKLSQTAERFVRPLPGGRLSAVAPLGFLMEKAFNVPAIEILGGPEWIKSEYYQIEAKAEGELSSDQLFVVLRSLLEDRFQLKTHRQTKELPVYLLLPAKDGLKLPPPKESNCWALDAPPQPPGRGRPAGFFKCGRLFNGSGDQMVSLKGGSVAMPELVRAVSILVGRPVIDKTGFLGAFDVNITFAPDPATRMSSLDPEELPSADSGPPNIFFALRQYLGLKLESSKAPVEILFIDSVERPAAN